MADAINRLIKKTQEIRQNSKTSCVILENYLHYQKSAIINNDEPNYLCGGCRSEKGVAKQSFKRAFRTLSLQQKSLFYLQNCTYLHHFIHQLPQQPIPPNLYTRTIDLRIGRFISKWITHTIQINTKSKIITLIQLKEQIDLHYFLIRKSKSQSRKCFVLESTEQSTTVETIRVSTPNQSQFEQLYQLVNKLFIEAQGQKIIKMLLDDNKYPHKQIKNVQSTMNIPQESLTLKLIDEVKGQIPLKDLNNLIQTQLSREDYQMIGCKIISSIIYFSLNSFINFVEIKPNLFYQKKGKIVRKIFKFPLQTSIPTLLKKLTQHQLFNKWKHSLHSIQLLQNIQSQKTLIFHEVDYYKNKLQIDYVYIRHQTVYNGVDYIIDKSTCSSFGPQSPTDRRGKINLVLWRFRQLPNQYVEVLVEADINHTTPGDQKSLTQQFIGQFDEVLKYNSHYNLQSTQLELNWQVPNTGDFGKQDISQISMDQLNNHHTNQQASFYSIDDQIDLTDPRKLQISQLIIPQKYQYPNLIIKHQNSSHYMIAYKHPLQPSQSNKIKNLSLPKKGHIIFGQQWKITEKGQLENTDQQKIKIQSSVLSLVVKQIGKNFFTGKSIINISLPIQLFSKQSYLEKICSTFTYAPIILEKPSLSTDPLLRFKAIIALQVGCQVNYIEMQKPFNPIIGQTYQGFIDGCPIYGQQISHHPPISAFFMKGRGYFIHCIQQPKIQMGLNSVSGCNQGYINVAFDTKDWNKNIVRYSNPYGQINGLILGNRLLRVNRNSQIIDQNNKLYCEIFWGKYKEKNDEMLDYYDSIYGKIFKLKPNFNFKEKPQVKDILEQIGEIKGRWTNKVYFNSECIFNSTQQLPCILEDCDHSLQSNSNKRKDIQLRKQVLWDQANDAKYELQKIQRYDAKLRKQKNNK